ncbi:MAG: M48 family metalloprotease [Actinobacteria bacterium]|nr:M48 family metalloprotease [Actinomycetota bacterium]
MAMRDNRGRDIYRSVARNRLRLAGIIAIFSLLVMSFSAGGCFLVYEYAGLRYSFWMVLLLFWLFYLLYAVLRYAFSGLWVFRSIGVLPESENDPRLEDALAAARLGAGLGAKIRLFEIPNDDINSFSIAFPDGSHGIFATRGMAEKLPAREREAIMAHELAHVMAGDSLLYTVMIRLVGPGSMRRIMSGWRAGSARYSFSEVGPPPLFLVIFVILLSDALRKANNTQTTQALPLAVVLLLFLTLASLLPLLMHLLLRLFFDREREYAADMQAAFITRDPEAVYLALKDAAEDVRDLLLLPSRLDALLFHPVVDYASYRPFRTQPTMAERMQRLQRSFPGLAA